MSEYNYIYYGDGDIRIEYPDPILGFDIRFDGTYIIESYNPNNFSIGYNNGRMIGVGLGSPLVENTFLKYTGELIIKECRIITSDMQEVYIIPKLSVNDRFGSIRNNFDGENAKFENLDKVGIVGEMPSSISVNIITRNLHTEGGDYLLDGIDYIGDYHRHPTGVAMTGADHTEDSVKLELKDKVKRTKRLLQTIRTIRTTPTGGGGY